jgi:intraflagellar transport protein 80
MYLACHALMQIFTYEGRPVSSLKPSGLRLEVLSEQLISLSNDTVAFSTGNILRCFDTAQGRAVGDAVTHKQEVKAVRLSQVRHS